MTGVVLSQIYQLFILKTKLELDSTQALSSRQTKFFSNFENIY